MRAWTQHLSGCLERLWFIICAPSVRLAAFFLFPYAALLVGLDVAARYGELTGQYLPVQFFLSQDRSFGEFLEYAVMLSMAVMLFAVGARGGHRIYVIFGALFLFLTADNALEVHENAGAALAFLFPQGLVLEPHHIAEGLIFAGIGIGLILSAVFGLREADAKTRYDAMIMLGLIGAVAFFGVVVDVLTSLGGQSNTSIQILAFVEDGGEFAMILISFLAILGMYERERDALQSEAPARTGHSSKAY